MTRNEARVALLSRLDTQRDELVELCRALARCDSQNPPGDTSAIARVCAEALRDVPGATITEVVKEAPCVNLTARLQGGSPGRRLLMNGHLDTAIMPQPEAWSVPPFGGVLGDNRIYGCGITDMKAGVAAQILAFRTLGEFRAALAGQLVLALVADEGTGASRGTLHLLDTIPEASGDALLSADVGSPLVMRFGEKGFVWLEVIARGVAAGGAHTYRGINAIERLMPALQALLSLREQSCRVFEPVRTAVLAAAERSEAVSGAGETAALLGITVNIGEIGGGRRINAVPATARAALDIRFPPGVASSDIIGLIEALTVGHAGIECRVMDRGEPTWTDPDCELVRLVRRNAAAVLGAEPAATIRAGFSDCRHYRQRGVPCVVLGVTPNNGNAPDEYTTRDDLWSVCAVHALTAFDYLGAET